MLFEQIAKNKRKTVLLFLVFFLFIAIVGAALGFYLLNSVQAGVIMSVVLGLVYAVYMFSQSTDVVMAMNHAHEIKRAEQAPALWHVVEDMAMVARVPMPRVFIIDDDSPNAFATGNKPEQAAVAATAGIIRTLNRDELEAVMAHEMTHVRNYDIRIQTLAVALTSAIAMLANFGTNFWYFGGNRQSDDRNDAGNIIGLIMSVLVLLLAPIIAMMMQMAISRNREYLADAGAVELTRNPQALIAALTKISQAPPMAAQNVSDTSASLYIGDPLPKASGLQHLFDSHPPMDKRIAAIKKL